MPEIVWSKLTETWRETAFSLVDAPHPIQERLTTDQNNTEEKTKSVTTAEVGSAKFSSQNIERLPTRRGQGFADTSLSAEDDTVLIVHPMSGEKSRFKAVAPKRNLHFRDGGSSSGDERAEFFRQWRLVPSLEHQESEYAPHIPASRQIPDHSIWAEADLQTAFFAANQDETGWGLLSVAIGPVQTFIAQARTARDLWSGSAILSYLSFAGMTAIAEKLGPTALVFPSLRANPLMDAWLAKEGLVPELNPDVSARKAPTLPHRFLAVVPWGPQGATATVFGQHAKDAVAKAWRDLGEGVAQKLEAYLEELDPNWRFNWNEQLSLFPEVYFSSISQKEMSDERLCQLLGLKDLEEGFPSIHAARTLDQFVDNVRGVPELEVNWAPLLEVAGRALEASRSIRSVPSLSKKVIAAPKCSMLGTIEALGPQELTSHSRVWSQAWRRGWNVSGIRVRAGEKLSAPALIKRYSPLLLARELGLELHKDLRIPDTASIAAAAWLKQAGIEPHKYRDWSGRWLFGEESDETKAPEMLRKEIRHACGHLGLSAPPKYYAILMMDGDHMGQWLTGQKAPSIRACYHPETLHYLESQRSHPLSKALDMPRPITPAYSAALSTALGNFAAHIAPQIVERHQGVTIYSGGDDILALLPVETALTCARELRLAFVGEPGGNGGAQDGFYRKNDAVHMVAGGATSSAGICIVHHMDDLRAALDGARRAEKTAKMTRDALGISLMKRSGESRVLATNWSSVKLFGDIQKLFQDGQSDRWAYKLRQILADGGADELPPQAQTALLRNALNRINNGKSDTDFTRHIEQAWEDYRHWQGAENIAGFVDLCLGASFMARVVKGAE